MRERLVQARAAGGVQTFEVRLRPKRRDALRTARIWLGAIHDATGALLGVHWLVRDITDEAELAERLRTQEAVYVQELRTRTMELEATVRLLQAELTALRGSEPPDSPPG